jgi:nucleoside permease NupC
VQVLWGIGGMVVLLDGTLANLMNAAIAGILIG